MPISDKLARQAVEKIRDQEREIHELRKRLGIADDLGSAIHASLQIPVQPDGGRSATVTRIVRKEIFSGEPVRKDRIGDRKREAADERQRQIDEAFRKSRGR